MRVDPKLSGGWLAFEGDGTRRRLSPVPPGWEALPDDALSVLCKRATAVTVRRGRLIDD